MITFKHQGDFKNIEKLFNKVSTTDYVRILEKYARQGVTALSSATPTDSGETANSWDFQIKTTKKGGSIVWTNSNVVDGVPIAVLIQYGHATKNGGYVQGRDYINPALKPIFDRIASDIWREVSEL